MAISENIEMYLVMIALFSEDNPGIPVPISHLADELHVQSVSVNQMVRKLDKEKLVKYLPYKGVELTEKGSHQALQIIRHRRLWEVFFVKHLDFTPSEADALACRLEHITTSTVSDRLSKFLDNPIMSSSGKAIPNINGDIPQSNQVQLSELQAGDNAEVTKLDTDKITTDYLNTQGLSPGCQIHIQAVSSNGNMLIEISSSILNLTTDLAEKILVQH